MKYPLNSAIIISLIIITLIQLEFIFHIFDGLKTVFGDIESLLINFSIGLFLVGVFLAAKQELIKE